MPEPLDWQQLRDIIAQLGAIEPEGDPRNSRDQRALYRVMDNREKPHPRTDEPPFDPLLDQRTNAELGQMDRYAMGKDVGENDPARAGIHVGLAGAYEADKALTGGKIAGMVTGQPALFNTDETSSPASLDNLKAFIQGIIDGGFVNGAGDVGGDDSAPAPVEEASPYPAAIGPGGTPEKPGSGLPPEFLRRLFGGLQGQ